MLTGEGLLEGSAPSVCAPGFLLQNVQYQNSFELRMYINICKNDQLPSSNYVGVGDFNKPGGRSPVNQIINYSPSKNISVYSKHNVVLLSRYIVFDLFLYLPSLIKLLKNLFFLEPIYF